MGGGEGDARYEGDVDSRHRPSRPKHALRHVAQIAERQSRGDAEGGRRQDGDGRSCAAHQGELRLRDPDARVDWPVVRGRRLQGRQAHGLVRIAGTTLDATRDRADRGAADGGDPGALSGCARMLWPERRGGRCRGCGAHLDADRQTGTSAMDARRRDRALAEEPAESDGPGSGHRCARQRRRMVERVLHPAESHGRFQAARFSIAVGNRGRSEEARQLGRVPLAERNSAIRLPKCSREHASHRGAGVPLAHLRTPGRLENAFANESFVDEIAARTEDGPGRISPEGVVRTASGTAARTRRSRTRSDSRNT